MLWGIGAVPVLPSAGDSESQVVGAVEHQSSPGHPEVLCLSFATSLPQESPLGGMRERTAWSILEGIHGVLNQAPWSFRQWIKASPACCALVPAGDLSLPNTIFFWHSVEPLGCQELSTFIFVDL